MVQYLNRHFQMEGSEFAHGWVRPEWAKGWDAYLFTRDPYTRACSQWWFRKNRGKHDLEFEDWLRAEKFLQSHLLEAEPNVIKRFEDLPNSFEELPFYRGGELPRVNSNFPGKPSNEELLTTKAKEIIADIYDEDFKAFNYEK
jgi:hypothetical protein